MKAISEEYYSRRTIVDDIEDFFKKLKIKLSNRGLIKDAIIIGINMVRNRMKGGE